MYDSKTKIQPKTVAIFFVFDISFNTKKSKKIKIMKRNILLTSFVFAKIIVVLSYLDIGKLSNMLPLFIIITAVLGILLLGGPYESKRDSKRVRKTVFFVAVFTILYFLILPILEYAFITESIKNIFVINMISGFVFLMLILISIIQGKIQFKELFQSKLIYISRFRYARIIFSTVMIFVSIISIIYSKGEIPLDNIAVITLLMAFP